MKSGFAAIIGRPNAGKSTLLNALAGEKIAAISNKPQTTRNQIMAIVTTPDKQVVFMDTPGIHTPRTKLGEFMIKEVEESMSAVDVVLLVVDVLEHASEHDGIIDNLKASGVPVLLILNKIDLCEKEKLLALIAQYNAKMEFAAIIPISALSGDGCGAVMEEIDKRLPEGPLYFPEDMITDQPEKQIAAEVIREKALWCLDKEVPHGIAVEITAFKENEKGILSIQGTIYCEKKSHKGIIIGKNGAMLKKIGTLARKDIEKFMGCKVFLELWVKIKEDWRNSDTMLKNFGYEK